MNKPAKEYHDSLGLELFCDRLAMGTSVLRLLGVGDVGYHWRLVLQLTGARDSSYSSLALETWTSGRGRDSSDWAVESRGRRSRTLHLNVVSPGSFASILIKPHSNLSLW